MKAVTAEIRLDAYGIQFCQRSLNFSDTGLVGNSMHFNLCRFASE